MKFRGFSLFFALSFALRVFAADPDDPLQSPNWPDLKKFLFADQQVIFDSRIKVIAPKVAEDSMNVPIGISVEGLQDVQEVLVIADLNPIIKVLQFYPNAVKAALSFRLKLQQASPVRAIARTKDGVWHAGGVWVDAAGGGCTAPSVGRSTGSWTDTLNQVQARIWQRDDGTRLRLRVSHPMDTGLAPGIPAFYIERLSLSDAAGKELMRLETYEPVSENPVFSFDLGAGQSQRGLSLSGIDNNGNRIRAQVVQ